MSIYNLNICVCVYVWPALSFSCNNNPDLNYIWDLKFYYKRTKKQNSRVQYVETYYSAS